MDTTSEEMREKREEAILTAFNTMLEIMGDKKASAEDRIKAARTIDGMSDSILAAGFTDKGLDAMKQKNRNESKLIDQVKRIRDNDED